METISRSRSAACLLFSSLVPLLLLLLIGATSTGSQTISRIGFDLSTVKDDGSNPDKVKGKVLLLDNEAQSPGVIFAFSVLVANTSPFTLQLYHVDVPGRTYRLGQEFTITPSVQKGREDIYIESLLNRRCVVIRPGDRLALSATTDTLAVQSKFNDTSQLLLCQLEQASGTLTCDQTYPVFIRAAAYYIVSNDSSLNSKSSDLVDCPLGTLIPGSRDVTTITTTTAPLITGAPGVMGSTGAQGATGSTGARGVVGSTGQQGSIGEVGPNGFKGVYGISGATGVMGFQGVIGVVGFTGSKGPSAIGDSGVHGIRGPPGRMGNNFTVFLNRPAPRNQASVQLSSDDSSDATDAFWSSSGAIWATYLWLAIVSSILIIVVIVVVFIVSMHRSLSSPSSASSIPVKATESQTNIMDEDYAPSNYSDLGSVEH